MMDRFRCPTTVAFAALLALLQVPYAAADPLTAARACTAIDDRHARVECYDRALGRVDASAATPRDGAAAPAAPIPNPPTQADAIAEFGLSEKARRERAGVEAPTSFDASVAAVGRNVANRQVVTLDNGQVWVQAEAATRLRLKSGDAVTIRRSALGSYLLAKPKHGSMRVTRLE